MPDFFELQRSEEIGVHVHPCPDGSQWAELLLEGGGHGIGLVYVLDGDLDAGNLIGRQAEQIARSRKGDEPERRIVFEHAGLENARNLVGTDAGLETGGGLLSGRRKEVDAAAHDQAEALCQFLADEHAGRRASTEAFRSATLPLLRLSSMVRTSGAVLGSIPRRTTPLTPLGEDNMPSA